MNMERQKSILGRKKKGQPTDPGDFIALGSKSKTGPDQELKRPASPPGSLGRKKESPTTSSGPSLAKKQKTGGPSSSPSLFLSSSRLGEGVSLSDDVAVPVDPLSLLSSILAAEDDGNEDRTEALLCGAVKLLRSNRAKPDSVLYLSLMHLAKVKPSLFCTEIVTESFCGLLKREMALTFKAKGNPLVSVLACNVLMSAFLEENNWPDSFVKVYVEDSLGERVWVDREDCRQFVDNIQTAFGTKRSPKHLMMTNLDVTKGDSPSSPVSASRIGEEEDMDTDNLDASVPPRYQYQQSAIETYIIETVKDVLNRRQPMDSSSRNLIRLMTATSGYTEVRNMAAQRMDMWLQNPKLTRVSQDLLLSVCTNCDQHDKTDLETMAHLTKMRMKTKQLINHFLTCMRELLSQHPDNLRMILNHTVYNELSTSRNPNNMPLMGTVFSHSPDLASKILAEIFQDLLVNKEDYLRALRMLLREIVRVTRLDMNFSAFCLGLMHERTEAKFVDMDLVLKERYVVSIADLVSMDVLLSVGHNVREAAAGLMQGDKKNLELIHVFKNKVALIERDSVWWMHIVVPKIIDLKPDVYLHCLKKVLFLESPEHYYNKDNWPPESERGLILRLVCEAPVLEDTLMRLLVIGLLRELPLSALDAITMVDQMVGRAALLYQSGLRDVLQMERLEFLDALLNLCVYKHPENIILPSDYNPPSLAITGLMWKAWLVLLVVTTYNPSVFGEAAWHKYPALQIFMEMVMTNNYQFPPPTTATDDKKMEEYRVQERQIRQQEIQLVIEFESHLAAATSKATITEANSHLIGQLHHNHPSGPARFPPAEVIEQLKSLNNTLKLGPMLCRSRSPDFLLQIINRQGTSQAMPWLADLVESSEGSLDVLPVQCLCEFLLHESVDGQMEGEDEEDRADILKVKQQKQKKHEQLLSRLQELVRSPQAETQTMREVLDYFLQRLSSVQATTRDQAIKGLSLVVAPPIHQNIEEEEDGDGHVTVMETDTNLEGPPHKWLLVHMPSLPLFEEVREPLGIAFRKACQVETDPIRLHCYVVYLAEHMDTDSTTQQMWNEMVLDLSQMLIERTSVVSHLLPELTCRGRQMAPDQQKSLASLIKIFLTFMKTARTEDKDTFNWSDSQDQILVKWEQGQSATIHILVVQAIVVLLTYGLPYDGEKRTSESNRSYQELLDMWVGVDGTLPSAFLLDTSEEALLLPDWLRLRMLRSQEERLVNAALQEVETPQLLLFIQSFGIPVSSVSRLLTALDAVLEDDPDSLSNALVDRQYLTPLMEVHRQRGAVGGQAFYDFIYKDQPPSPQHQEETKTETEEEDQPTQESWNVKGSGEIILPNSVDKISRLLDQIFSEKTGDDKGPAKLFQCFLQITKAFYQFMFFLPIQAVSTDKVKAAAVIRSFDNLLSSSKREAFADKVYTATYRSCPILKIIHAKQPDLHPELLTMMEKLQSLGQGRKSMMTSLLTQVMTSTSKVKQTKAPSLSKRVDGLIKKTSGKGGYSAKQFMEGLLSMGDNPVSLERAIEYTMDHYLTKGSAKVGTDIACLAMNLQTHQTGMSGTCAKLFIDWLSLLDPEIVQLSPDMEQRLLFAHKAVHNSDTDTKGQGSPVSCQAHLLALLTHETNWQTLTGCLARLLDRNTLETLDPTAALDFIWACAHIPKVWRGRERKAHESVKGEDILGLTVVQVYSLVDLIIQEACLDPLNTRADDGGSCVVSHRLNLLLLCLGEDKSRLAAAVGRLHEIYSSSSSMSSSPEGSTKPEIVLSMATQLYLHFPSIHAWLPESSSLATHMMQSSHLQSQIDVVSHRMITSLGQIKTRTQTDKGKMYDANIACRKLAAHHPAIFLRQLPLMSSILSGQTAFSLSEMRHTNRLLLYTHVLGLLELLQPRLFERQHTGLCDVLQSYFVLMENHGKETKALGSMLVKLVNILQNFLQQDPDRALPLLNKHTDLFSHLSYLYPDMLELKALVTSLTLPHQPDTVASSSSSSSLPPPSSSSNNSSVKHHHHHHHAQHHSSNTSSSMKGLGGVETSSDGQGGYTMAQLAPFVRRFGRQASEDVYVVLQDLDELSKRKVDILSHFQSQLQKLLSSPHDLCRSTAFTLVMRYLRYNPRKSETFVSSYLDCLENEDPAIVTSALKNLPEFCALCQEDANTILQTAFQVGIKTCLDTGNHIGEALHMMNLHVV